MSNAYGGIGFCKEEAKTFAQLLLHWDHGMNNGRQIKSFLWRHKFPLGCGGHVSKFPIQSLYYPWFERNLLRFARARAHVRGLLTQKSCAVGMRNAILRNYLNWPITYGQLYGFSLTLISSFSVLQSNLHSLHSAFHSLFSTSLSSFNIARGAWRIRCVKIVKNISNPY